jgi:hypothetical protein
MVMGAGWPQPTERRRRALTTASAQRSAQWSPMDAMPSFQTRLPYENEGSDVFPSGVGRPPLRQQHAAPGWSEHMASLFEPRPAFGQPQLGHCQPQHQQHGQEKEQQHHQHQQHQLPKQQWERWPPNGSGAQKQEAPLDGGAHRAAPLGPWNMQHAPQPPPQQKPWEGWQQQQQQQQQPALQRQRTPQQQPTAPQPLPARHYLTSAALRPPQPVQPAWTSAQPGRISAQPAYNAPPAPTPPPGAPPAATGPGKPRRLLAKLEAAGAGLEDSSTEDGSRWPWLAHERRDATGKRPGAGPLQTEVPRTCGLHAAPCS